MFVTPGKLTMLHKGRLPIGFFHVKRTGKLDFRLKVASFKPLVLLYINYFYVYLLYIDVQPFCFSVALGNFMDSNRISLPINVDTAKTTRFSSTVTRAHSYISSINITTYNSFNAVLGSLSFCKDPLVQSYDFFGLISLSSAMRSNVPMPFRGLNKFSHLKMPGGQCSEEYKFIAQNLEFSHNSGLRNCLQADRATYQNAFLDSNGKGEKYINLILTLLRLITKGKHTRNQEKTLQMMTSIIRYPLLSLRECERMEYMLKAALLFSLTPSP